MILRDPGTFTNSATFLFSLISSWRYRNIQATSLTVVTTDTIQEREDMGLVLCSVLPQDTKKDGYQT